MLGRAVFYAAAKAQEVLHFWGEFAAVSPDELVTEGGSFYLPDDVLFIFRMTSPCFESLFPIHRQAQELATSNDASSRGTKTCCPRRFTYLEFPVLTGLKDQALLPRLA